MKHSSRWLRERRTFRGLSILYLTLICFLWEEIGPEFHRSLGVQAESLSEASPRSSSSPTFATSTIPSTGSIEDLSNTCRIEDIEHVNDVQLYEILQNLKHMTAIRNFVVDLQHICPFSPLLPAKKETTHSPPPSDSQGEFKDAPDNSASEAQCSGGKDELDDDAEPLCSVQGGTPGDTKSFLPQSRATSRSSKRLLNPGFQSNVLNHLKKTGFTSKSQQETFTWKDMTDTVFTETEIAPSIPTVVGSTIPEDQLLPDSFWTDMCSPLIGSVGDRSTVINLALNPERNTGYNGTHIWRAIYEENCIVSNNSPNDSVPSINGTQFHGQTAEFSNMCLEERVMYRLLSGLHSSTTISIAKHYYPPSRKKNRTTWEPNPTYFMEKFQQNPEHIRNLHFTYVVLLRALSKASTFLYNYAFDLEAIVDKDDPLDEEEMTTTQKLIRRLLDSSILQSCHSVFSAFDESQLFQEDDTKGSSSNKVDVALLRRNFKGVFHNVSAIFDCVQCQQCKLHGKLVMLGYGAALKVLLMQNSMPQLEQNEIVALMNTIIKFSESIRDVRDLSKLYVQEQLESSLILNDGIVLAPIVTVPAAPSVLQGSVVDTGNGDVTVSSAIPTPASFDLALVDRAVGVVAALGRTQRISFPREQELIQLAFQKHAELLILMKHYHADLEKLVPMLQHIAPISSSAQSIPDRDITADAIVVGSGLAGLATALNLLDRGGRVIVVEKEHLLGGNSGKASSGINACCLPNRTNPLDSLELFWNDTFRSAGSSVKDDLITTLVSNSAEAVTWLQRRLGVDLSLVAQLGGHSTKRTHRPKNGMVGAEIIYALQKAVKSFAKTNQVTILTDTKVTKLLTDRNGAVVGVECVSSSNPSDTEPFQLFATNVVLATGGFAADRSEDSFLSKYRPELLKMPATAGSFSTGDGIHLATQLGAATIDMDKVQVHPTGWVDPSDPTNRSKILAGELMRGVGGILVNSTGQRFCNELGTRSYVTNKMLSHDPGYAQTGNWSINATVPTFSLILSSAAALDGKKHVDLYTHKGLLKRLEGVDALAEWMELPRITVVNMFEEYRVAAARGYDDFGKQAFNGVPSKDLNQEIFYAGKVTPVLHYCMGGIVIDKEGNVLNSSGEIIPGLHAAGEVSGGVHGVNRLGGNSLLECTVYGTIVGQKLPIRTGLGSVDAAAKPSSLLDNSEKPSSNRSRIITSAELGKHNTPDDCWVAIHDKVYDLSDFAGEHPAGPQSIFDLAGLDGTEAFTAVHNPNMLDDFDEEIMGIYQPSMRKTG
jgi:flavocytochrome c